MSTRRSLAPSVFTSFGYLIGDLRDYVIEQLKAFSCEDPRERIDILSAASKKWAASQICLHNLINAVFEFVYGEDGSTYEPVESFVIDARRSEVDFLTHPLVDSSFDQFDLLCGRDPRHLDAADKFARRQVLRLFDVERFTLIAAFAYENLSNMADAESIVSSPFWAQRNLITQESFWHKSYLSPPSFKGSPVQKYGSALNSVAEAREGSLRHFLATLMSESLDDYRTFCSRNSGVMYKKAAARFASIDLRLDEMKAYRDAAYHHNFHVDDGRLVITDKDGSMDVFEEREFFDQVARIIETNAALAFGFQRFLIDRKVVLTERPAISPIAADANTALLLVTKSVDVVSLSSRPDEMVMEVRGDIDDAVQFTSIAASESSLSQNTLSVRVIGETRQWALKADLQYIRSAQEAMPMHWASLNLHEEHDPLYYYVWCHVASAIEVDGDPFMTDAEWPMFAGAACRPSPHEQKVESLRRAVRLRQRLKEVGAESGVEICETWVQGYRSEIESR